MIARNGVDRRIVPSIKLNDDRIFIYVQDSNRNICFILCSYLDIFKHSVPSI